MVSIRRYTITGSQRISNYWWGAITGLGGAGFLFTGFSTLLQRDVLLFRNTGAISFFPQGLIMCFYGSLGLLFGTYLWCTIFWKVGSGFNEFDKERGVVRIFRWGLPGRERRIDLLYSLQDVEGVRVELNEGVNPRRVVSLRIREKGNIPLTQIGQPIGLEEIENEASELAQFLQVALETLYDA